MSKTNVLDKFYTNDDVALSCWQKTIDVLGYEGQTPLVEPSAGGGAFCRAFEATGYAEYDAFDIEPECDGVERCDFLAYERPYDGSVCVGNPPFGHRSSLAVKLFNHCATFADAICFVIPITFSKWSVQSKLDERFKLVYSERLADDSFNANGQPYSIRCLYQIWVRRGGMYDREDFADLRLKSAPPISKPDAFKIWQHNATDGSRRYVDEDWEIAVYRQGYKDYAHKFRRPDDYDEVRRLVYETNIQLFFVKPLTEHARKVIDAIDFEELAMSNLSTPGFGKRDFVQCYEETERRLMQQNSTKL